MNSARREEEETQNSAEQHEGRCSGTLWPRPSSLYLGRFPPPCSPAHSQACLPSFPIHSLFGLGRCSKSPSRSPGVCSGDITLHILGPPVPHRCPVPTGSSCLPAPASSPPAQFVCESLKQEPCPVCPGHSGHRTRCICEHVYASRGLTETEEQLLRQQHPNISWADCQPRTSPGMVLSSLHSQHTTCGVSEHTSSSPPARSRKARRKGTKSKARGI